MNNISPQMAKFWFFMSVPFLILHTLVVVVNLWGLINHIFYSLPALIVFTVLCLAIIYMMTKYQQIAWPK